MLEVFSSWRVSYVSNDATQKGDLEVRYMRRDLPIDDPMHAPASEPSDPRSLCETDLSGLVEEVGSLCDVQGRRLYEVLVKYLSHMTTKSGRCNLFSYKFQVDTDESDVEI
jgi:hypothetical protein